MLVLKVKTATATHYSYIRYAHLCLLAILVLPIVSNGAFNASDQNCTAASSVAATTTAAGATVAADSIEAAIALCSTNYTNCLHHYFRYRIGNNNNSSNSDNGGILSNSNFSGSSLPNHTRHRFNANKNVNRPHGQQQPSQQRASSSPRYGSDIVEITLCMLAAICVEIVPLLLRYVRKRTLQLWRHAQSCCSCWCSACPKWGWQQPQSPQESQTPHSLYALAAASKVSATEQQHQQQHTPLHYCCQHRFTIYALITGKLFALFAEAATATATTTTGPSKTLLLATVPIAISYCSAKRTNKPLYLPHTAASNAERCFYILLPQRLQQQQRTALYETFRLKPQTTESCCGQCASNCGNMYKQQRQQQRQQQQQQQSAHGDSMWCALYALVNNSDNRWTLQPAGTKNNTNNTTSVVSKTQQQSGQHSHRKRIRCQQQQQPLHTTLSHKYATATAAATIAAHAVLLPATKSVETPITTKKLLLTTASRNCVDNSSSSYNINDNNNNNSNCCYDTCYYCCTYCNSGNNSHASANASHSKCSHQCCCCWRWCFCCCCRRHSTNNYRNYCTHYCLCCCRLYCYHACCCCCCQLNAPAATREQQAHNNYSNVSHKRPQREQQQQEKQQRLSLMQPSQCYDRERYCACSNTYCCRLPCWLCSEREQPQCALKIKAATKFGAVTTGNCGVDQRLPQLSKWLCQQLQHVAYFVCRRLLALLHAHTAPATPLGKREQQLQLLLQQQQQQQHQHQLLQQHQNSAASSKNSSGRTSMLCTTNDQQLKTNNLCKIFCNNRKRHRRRRRRRRRRRISKQDQQQQQQTQTQPQALLQRSSCCGNCRIHESGGKSGNVTLLKPFHKNIFYSHACKTITKSSTATATTTELLIALQRRNNSSGTKQPRKCSITTATASAVSAAAASQPPATTRIYKRRTKPNLVWLFIGLVWFEGPKFVNCSFSSTNSHQHQQASAQQQHQHQQQPLVPPVPSISNSLAQQHQQQYQQQHEQKQQQQHAQLTRLMSGAPANKQNQQQQQLQNHSAAAALNCMYKNSNSKAKTTTKHNGLHTSSSTIINNNNNNCMPTSKLSNAKRAAASRVDADANADADSTSYDWYDAAFVQDQANSAQSDEVRLESIKRQILTKLGLTRKPNVTHPLPKQFIWDTIYRADGIRSVVGDISFGIGRAAQQLQLQRVLGTASAAHAAEMSYRTARLRYPNSGGGSNSNNYKYNTAHQLHDESDTDADAYDDNLLNFSDNALHYATMPAERYSKNNTHYRNQRFNTAQRYDSSSASDISDSKLTYLMHIRKSSVHEAAAADVAHAANVEQLLAAVGADVNNDNEDEELRETALQRHFGDTDGDYKYHAHQQQQQSYTSTPEQDLYESEDFFGSTQEIITFGESGHMYKQHRLVEFSPQSNKVPNQKLFIRNAEIHIRVDPIAWRVPRAAKTQKGCKHHHGARTPNLKIWIFQLLGYNYTQKGFDQVAQLCASFSVDTQQLGWQKFELTETVRRWYEQRPLDKLRLLIDCTGCGSQYVLHLFEPQMQQKQRSKLKRKQQQQKKRPQKQQREQQHINYNKHGTAAAAHEEAPVAAGKVNEHYAVARWMQQRGSAAAKSGIFSSDDDARINNRSSEDNYDSQLHRTVSTNFSNYHDVAATIKASVSQETTNATTTATLPTANCKNEPSKLYNAEQQQQQQKRQQRHHERRHVAQHQQQQQHNDIADHAAPSPNRPFLVLRTETKRLRRVRRRAIDCMGALHGQCCKESFYVSFKALGWDDWIIAPRGYFANYCRGDCTGPFRTPDTFQTFHAHFIEEYRKMGLLNGMQPCCAPVKFSSMSLIYYGDDGIIKRDLPKMVVDECGCP